MKIAAVLLLLLSQLPAHGPIYDLLEQYPGTGAASDEEAYQWAEAILDALRANPEEEWSTRVRAYEEAASVYWRRDEYDYASPVLLELWQEAERRGDADTAVTSLDHLINVYDEAGYPPREMLDLYDATENWLNSPPEGQEELYARMLYEIYGERASRLETYAQDESLTEEERAAYFEEAAYYRELAAGNAPPRQFREITLQDIARQWLEKNQGSAPDEMKASQDDVAEPSATSLPPTAAPAPPALSPAPVISSPAPPVTSAATPPPPAPAESATGWVLPLAIGIIVLGWGLAAAFYLRRR